MKDGNQKQWKLAEENDRVKIYRYEVAGDAQVDLWLEVRYVKATGLWTAMRSNGFPVDVWTRLPAPTPDHAVAKRTALEALLKSLAALTVGLREA